MRKIIIAFVLSYLASPLQVFSGISDVDFMVCSLAAKNEGAESKFWYDKDMVEFCEKVVSGSEDNDLKLAYDFLCNAVFYTQRLNDVPSDMKNRLDQLCMACFDKLAAAGISVPDFRKMMMSYKDSHLLVSRLNLRQFADEQVKKGKSEFLPFVAFMQGLGFGENPDEQFTAGCPNFEGCLAISQTLIDEHPVADVIFLAFLMLETPGKFGTTLTKLFKHFKQANSYEVQIASGQKLPVLMVSEPEVNHVLGLMYLTGQGVNVNEYLGRYHLYAAVKQSSVGASRLLRRNFSDQELSSSELFDCYFVDAESDRDRRDNFFREYFFADKIPENYGIDSKTPEGRKKAREDFKLFRDWPKHMSEFSQKLAAWDEFKLELQKVKIYTDMKAIESCIKLIQSLFDTMESYRLGLPEKQGPSFMFVNGLESKREAHLCPRWVNGQKLFARGEYEQKLSSMISEYLKIQTESTSFEENLRHCDTRLAEIEKKQAAKFDSDRQWQCDRLREFKKILTTVIEAQSYLRQWVVEGAGFRSILVRKALAFGCSSQQECLSESEFLRQIVRDNPWIDQDNANNDDDDGSE